MDPSNALVVSILRTHTEYLTLSMSKFKNLKYLQCTYRKAAENIEDLRRPLDDVALADIPGVGKKISAKIIEILETGELRELNQQIKRHGDLRDLMSVKGIGIKTAKKLYRKHRVTTRTGLLQLIQVGKINNPTLSARLQISTERICWDDAYSIFTKVADQLPFEMKCAGSLRRESKTVGDIDILIESPEAIDTFCSLGPIVEKGKRKCAIVTDGACVELNIIDRSQWGTALLHMTGSKDFNKTLRASIKQDGWCLNEYGLFREGEAHRFREEEEVFQFLGREYVAPALRS